MADQQRGLIYDPFSDRLVTADEARQIIATQQQQGGARPPLTPPPSPATQPQPQGITGMADAGEGLARGALKGVGETAFHLGDLARHIPSDLFFPGLSTLTGATSIGDVGGQIGGMSADQAFAQVPEDLIAKGGGEKTGKALEQIAEFFLPAGKVGMAQRGASSLVTHLPKAAGTVRRLATDAAWKAAPVIDDALSAAGTAMSHGEDWSGAANAAAGSGLTHGAGIGVGQLTKLLATKAGRQLAPLIAAILGMKGAAVLGADIAGTGAAGWAANAAARNLTRRVLSPSNQGRLMWGAESVGQRAAPVAAGVVDNSRQETRRRQP